MNAPPPDLFDRVRAGDPLATSEFAAAYLDLVVAHLRRNHSIDDHLVQTAAEDAIIALLKNPDLYKPERGGLEAYLCMAARGDLLNALEKEARRNRKRENVELDAVVRNTGDDASDLPSFDDPMFAPVLASFTDGERAAFELMRGGERSTAAFAQALGLTDRTPDEQAAEVKRVKDRIKQRLTRAARGS